MKKQFGIIGLGNFGYYLATRLYEKGHDVIAIDKNHGLVQDIRDMVTKSIVADATDPKALNEIGLKDMDVVVVCIGSSLSHSILATLNLLELGISNVYAKAISDAHARILKKIGVSQVYFPEKDSAISLANQMHNPNVIDYLPFLEGYSIIQLAPPRQFIGKSLRELDLINQYGVQVIAIRELVPDRLNMIPTGTFILKDSDILFIIGPDTSLEKLREKTR